MYEQLKTSGIVFLKNYVPRNLINNLLEAVDVSFEKHRSIQINQGNDIVTDGVALNVLSDHPAYIDLLNHFLDCGVIKELENHFFESKFILNSMSALDNKTNQPNFSAIVHRDIKCFSNGLPLMLNALVMLDDFTYENGATKLLPYSHLVKQKPSEEYFRLTNIRAIGKRGDLLLFDSNIWHCSALNKTNERRRAIPMTFSKSFMKQMFDYPKYLGEQSFTSKNAELLQLIGYDSRVASTLEEWYQPSDKRLYKKNQD